LVGVLGTTISPYLFFWQTSQEAELFAWRASLELKPREAPRFYLVLAIGTVAAMSLTLIGIDPMRALFWSATTSR
jgi:Mn2+/Fe2+ NRAMP family transporter